MNKTISKSKLKAKMLEIFRSLEASGEELVVTDRGKPVLRIVPYEPKDSLATLFSAIQGNVVYHEDIDTPTSGEWTEL